MKKIIKYINVLTLLSLVFFAGGLMMILNNKESTGMTMSKMGNGRLASINGYTVMFVGSICLIAGIIVLPDKEGEE